MNCSLVVNCCEPVKTNCCLTWSWWKCWLLRDTICRKGFTVFFLLVLWETNICIKTENSGHQLAGPPRSPLLDAGKHWAWMSAIGCCFALSHISEACQNYAKLSKLFRNVIQPTCGVLVFIGPKHGSSHLGAFACMQRKGDKQGLNISDINPNSSGFFRSNARNVKVSLCHGETPTRELACTRFRCTFQKFAIPLFPSNSCTKLKKMN